VDGQLRYDWEISFEPAGEYWSPQSRLIGGSPAGVDLEAVLRAWFHKRGGPAARWRLQVCPLADESTVVAEVVLTFTEAAERPVKRLGPKRPPLAPTFWTTTELLPPSPAQRRAWAQRDAER
jgi:hypothetical protein